MMLIQGARDAGVIWSLAADTSYPRHAKVNPFSGGEQMIDCTSGLRT
jgi:hypothetical protein